MLIALLIVACRGAASTASGPSAAESAGPSPEYLGSPPATPLTIDEVIGAAKERTTIVDPEAPIGIRAGMPADLGLEGLGLVPQDRWTWVITFRGEYPVHCPPLPSGYSCPPFLVGEEDIVLDFETGDYLMSDRRQDQ
jgi:hypothetical protein